MKKSLLLKGDRTCDGSTSFAPASFAHRSFFHPTYVRKRSQKKEEIKNNHDPTNTPSHDPISLDPLRPRSTSPRTTEEGKKSTENIAHQTDAKTVKNTRPPPSPGPNLHLFPNPELPGIRPRSHPRMEGSPRPAEGLVHGGHLGDRACGGGASGTARSCAATAPAAGGSGPRSNPSGKPPILFLATAAILASPFRNRLHEELAIHARRLHIHWVVPHVSTYACLLAIVDHEAAAQRGRRIPSPWSLEEPSVTSGLGRKAVCGGMEIPWRRTGDSKELDTNAAWIVLCHVGSSTMRGFDSGESRGHGCRPNAPASLSPSTLAQQDPAMSPIPWLPESLVGSCSRSM